MHASEYMRGQAIRRAVSGVAVSKLRHTGARTRPCPHTYINIHYEPHAVHIVPAGHLVEIFKLEANLPANSER